MKAGTRVLIVEDDRSIARVVQLQLQHRGFSVRCCHDGISAVQEVPKFRPEVIVLDVMLPGLDGVDERLLPWGVYLLSGCGLHITSESNTLAGSP